MSRKHISRFVISVGAAALVLGLAVPSAGATKAATTTRTVTFTGTQFRALDSGDVTRLAPNTGGGIWVQRISDKGPAPTYLEVPLELPAGARLVSVTFFIRNCYGTTNANQPYVGAFNPATNSFRYIVAEFTPPKRGCAVTQAIKKVIAATPGTVPNTQRAVLGYHATGEYDHEQYSPTTIKELLVGARIVYQV